MTFNFSALLVFMEKSFFWVLGVDFCGIFCGVYHRGWFDFWTMFIVGKRLSN